jgi:hypothetical protein
MNESVRRELMLAAGNMLLLKLVAQALKEGKISQAEFSIIAECMAMLLETFEKANPLKAEDKKTIH